MPDWTAFACGTVFGVGMTLIVLYALASMGSKES